MWISGWIGLLVSFVGLDAIHGVSRFTFGSFYLDDGIGFIPVLIGLFGISEILRVLPQKSPPRIPSEVGPVLPSMNALVKYLRPAFRSGIIGTVIGAIPERRAPTWPRSLPTTSVAGGQRKRSAASGGRAVTRPSYARRSPTTPTWAARCCPHIALGIPGNAAAAAILAALQLKSVVPGPLIQVENPGLIYFIYIGLIIANFFMYAMAIALIKPCV